jgi:oligopeptide/dipeptide ABC transporter ATP-binding protein
MPDLANPGEMCSFSLRCPFVMEVCKTERPRLGKVDGGEEVACWLY